MSKTHISIQGERFFINGVPTYAEIPGSRAKVHGLLMNARFIQGLFDDKAAPERFARFGRTQFDPDENTDELIKALPEWYRYGLRAFTVGLQGGGPVFTIDDWSSIDNSPFSPDGKRFDPACEKRLHRLLKAADDMGMIVIVSLFYQAQSHRLQDGRAYRNAVKTACSVLKDGGYTNVLIEVANEHTVGRFREHPIVHSSEGISYLVELARETSGGMPAGSSAGGGEFNRELCEVSDYILIHGNGLTRQHFYNLIKGVRNLELNKPIVCNEDSPCISQLEVALQHYASWGYYNNLTKQEPPTNWGITPGEDTFFAHRMAEGIGIEVPSLAVEDQYYLQGFESDITVDGKRWVRLASLYPESINYVEFLRNGRLIDTAYDEPFMVDYRTSWIQGPIQVERDDKEWEAVIHLRNGQVVTRKLFV